MNRKEIQRKYDISEKGKISKRKRNKRYAIKYPEKIKANNRKTSKRYILKYPEKIKAHILARKLPNKFCSIRGCNKKGEKHHEDYTKPLDVLYFCNQHHRQIYHEKTL